MVFAVVYASQYWFYIFNHPNCDFVPFYVLLFLHWRHLRSLWPHNLFNSKWCAPKSSREESNFTSTKLPKVRRKTVPWCGNSYQSIWVSCDKPMTTICEWAMDFLNSLNVTFFLEFSEWSLIWIVELFFRFSLPISSSSLWPRITRNM